jgi:hypothetical protein
VLISALFSLRIPCENAKWNVRTISLTAECSTIELPGNTLIVLRRSTFCNIELGHARSN